jgi:Protein of unknown function DUF2625
MKALLLTFGILIAGTQILTAQAPMRTLAELVNTEDPGWAMVTEWMKDAKNPIEVLPRDKAKAEEALLQLNVTTRSSMGAIVYETGGILVDGGWIRILGSGSEKLPRAIMAWNKGKSWDVLGEELPFLLIADDAAGGFFAINNGAISPEDIGKVFYFSPDNLTWEPTGKGYSDFVYWCFVADLEDYYTGIRWKGWQDEIKTIGGDRAMSFMPPLFTKEGKNVNKVSRAAVPIEELWNLYVAAK